MKKIIFLICLVASISAKSQSVSGICAKINCPITLIPPLDSAQITCVPQLSNPLDSVISFKWVATGSAGTISTPSAATTWVKGLTTPGTYTFSVTFATKFGNIYTATGDAIIVLPPPVVPSPPVVTGVSITLFGQTFTVPSGQGSTITISYNGTTQTVKF